MENKKKRIIVIVSIILAIAIIVGIVFVIIANKNSDDVKVYDNVYIITKEESQSNIPIRVTENELVFSEDQHYSKDDIIVSGVTDTAPNGFMRKVVRTDIIDNQYIVETTYACLTDVFEEAHVSKIFSISDEAVTPIDATETDINAKIETLTPAKSFLNTLSIGTIIPNENSGADLISLDIKKNITENIYVTGSVGYRPYLLMDFDIENHEIEYSMSIKNTTSGRLAVELGAEKGFNESIELFSKNLPIIEFMVGEVPIIITNSVSATLDGSGGIRGSLGTEITLDYENTTGFKYSSSTNQVEEIKESTYLGDGIEWNTKASASADIEVGVFIHIVSKLYDSTGVDLAAGITGGAEAEIMASPNKQFNNLNYAGNIGLNITPKLKGDIVVTVPILDNYLYSQPLFESALNPLWKWNWESSNSWKNDIQNIQYDSISNNSVLYKVYYEILRYFLNGTNDNINFEVPPAFEDNYLGDFNGKVLPIIQGPTEIISDFYGMHLVYCLRDINDDETPELFIGYKANNKYEILAVYGYTFYKGENYTSNGGACLATIGYLYDNEFDYNYLYLTEDNALLVRENAEVGGKLKNYNKSKGFSEYSYSNYKGDNSDIIDSNILPWKELTQFSSDLDKPQSNTTAKNTTEKTTQSTTNYISDDWISLDNLKSEIGDKFTSGNGIKYTVIAIEDNYDVGGSRERMVLESQSGDKMMIANIPNFLYDEKRGNYFEITKYYSDSDYKTH